MSLPERRKFTFTWQIQNFSMCPLKQGECLKSPVFVVDMLKKSEWYLIIFLRSKIREDSMSCYLKCTNTGTYIGDVRIGFSITACSIDINKIVMKEVENQLFETETFESPFYISRQTILDDRDSYLPNDTFTLQCSLWEPDGFADVLESEVLDTFSRDNILFSGLLQPDPCSVVSRIQVHRKTVSWPIRRFSSISPNKRLTMLVHTALRDLPSFFLTIYKSIEDQGAEIEIKKTGCARPTVVSCKISVVSDIAKAAACFEKDEHVFESGIDNPVWKFPSFIKFNKLQENKYLDRTHDVLYLRFEFTFSHTGDMAVVLHVEKESSSQFQSFTNVSPPIEEFVCLYRYGTLSDVTIRTGDRDFKVHKSILHARSPVFSAMFDNDMKEKETGVVDITDVDADTMDRMLGFMYTNVFEDVQTEDAAKLYSVADKYQVLPLKLRCTEVLASTLSVANVCDVLRLADLHDGESLYQSAENFVHANSDVILKSREWDDLIKSNGTLAAKVMHKMLVNYTIY